MVAVVVGVDEVLERLVGHHLTGLLDDRQGRLVVARCLDDGSIRRKLDEQAVIASGQIPDPGGPALRP